MPADGMEKGGDPGLGFGRPVVEVEVKQEGKDADFGPEAGEETTDEWGVGGRFGFREDHEFGG